MFVVGRSFGHYALQSYIKELRAKGEKVTLQELVASLSTNTNDSVEILTSAVSKLGPLPAELTNLNAKPFIESGPARIVWGLPAPPWADSTNGNALSTWAAVSNHVRQMTVPLAELREAMKRPAANAGFRTDYFLSVTPWRAVKEAMTWLEVAALVELHNQRQAKALRNVQAIAGLADLHREEYSLVSHMARVAATRAGLDVTWQALQANGWNEEQLAALQRCWTKVDLLQGLERGLEFERGFPLEAVERLRSEGRLGTRPIYSRLFLANDLLFALRLMQARVELARSLRANNRYKDVLNGLEVLNGQLERKLHSPMKFFYLTTATAIPNLMPPFWLTARIETERRLAVAAIALKRYELKNGHFPSSLNALVPDFLGAVPYDCMSGRPLCYRLNDDQTFALYSVGEDGKDDGGDPSSVAPDGKLGLWQCRDAVWPWPADAAKPVVSKVEATRPGQGW
jgi:hypothetical protein